VRRRARRGLAAGLLLLGGTALAACSGQSSSLAKQACAEVSQSIRLFNESSHASGAERQTLLDEAQQKLDDAEPKAGLASGTDTDYQALAATLSESARVPESDLIQALSAQCAQFN
jgi:hypothetical protein